MHAETKHEEAVGCSAEPAMLSVSAARSEEAASTPTRPSTQTVATSFTPSPGVRVAMASPSVPVAHRDPTHDASAEATPDVSRAAGSPSVSRSRTLLATYTTRRTVSEQPSGAVQDAPSPAIAPPVSPSHSRTTRRESAGAQRGNAQASSRRSCVTTRSPAGATRRRAAAGSAAGRTASVAAAKERGSRAKDEERRRSQREKQASYGYVTEGYKNMVRLIEHDPLLKSGGVIPLSPPELSVGSKRTWDIQLRKWRRALHMFDYVYIDGIDPPAQRAIATEAQRRQWVSEDYEELPKEARVRHSLRSLRAVRDSPLVPTRIPVEDGLRCILRSAECYESVRNVVPQSASSLTKGTDISPLEAGIKIHIAPSAGVLRRQQEQQEQHQQLQEMLLRQQQQQQQPQQRELSLSPARERETRSGATTVVKARTEAAQQANSPSPKRPTSRGRKGAAGESVRAMHRTQAASTTTARRPPSASRPNAASLAASDRSHGEDQPRGQSRVQQPQQQTEEGEEEGRRSPAQRLTYGSAARSGARASQRPPATSQPLSHAAMPFYGPTAPPPQQLLSRPIPAPGGAAAGNVAGTATMPNAPRAPVPATCMQLCPSHHHHHHMFEYDQTHMMPAMQPPAAMVWPTSMPYYPVMCPYAAAPALVQPPAAVQPCACCGYAPMMAPAAMPMMMMVPPYATMMPPQAPPPLPPQMAAAATMPAIAPHLCPAGPLGNNTNTAMMSGAPMAPPRLVAPGGAPRAAPHYVSSAQPPAPPSSLPPPLSVEQLQSGTATPSRAPASAPAHVSHYQRRHAPVTPQARSAMQRELSLQRTPHATTSATPARTSVPTQSTTPSRSPLQQQQQQQQQQQLSPGRQECGTPATAHEEEAVVRTVAAPHVRHAERQQREGKNEEEEQRERELALVHGEGSVAETVTPARALLDEASVEITTTARVVEPRTSLSPDAAADKEVEVVLGKATLHATVAQGIEREEGDSAHTCTTRDA